MVGETHVINGDNVGVIQRRCGARFKFEAVTMIGVGI